MDGITTRWTVLGAEFDIAALSCSSTGPKGDWDGFMFSCRKSSLDEAGWTSLFVRSKV